LGVTIIQNYNIQLSSYKMMGDDKTFLKKFPQVEIGSDEWKLI
jgi:hypothetical protein